MDKFINWQSQNHFDHLPQNMGRFTLSSPQPSAIWNILPYHGEIEAVSAALNIPLKRGEWCECDLGKIVDNGWDSFLLICDRENALDAQSNIKDLLQSHAAVFDVSESFAIIRLAGERVFEVLERLVPVDLRRKSTNAQWAIRSLMGHISVLMVQIESGVEIFVPASMAQSAYHELVEAIETVSAQPAF